MSDQLVLMDYIQEHGMDSCIFEPFVIGNTYYFRGAVYSCVGRVVGYGTHGKSNWLRLDRASYVGTDGRYGSAVRDGFGEDAELEYAGEMVVNLDHVGDAVLYQHELQQRDV